MLGFHMGAKVHRVPFHQQKKGFPSLTCRVMNSLAAAMVSSSIVSIRFLVSGRVSSTVWPPLPSALDLSTPCGPKLQNSGSFG